jgi:transcriptional regulator with XRE-family HTH domain
LHPNGKYIKIEEDKSIVENFTKNFHDLHDNLKINYRKLGKAIDMSIGNLSRLAQGNEPMLSAVIKLTDFFGISITQMLSENPNFDYEKIQKVIEEKTGIANLPPVISDKKIKKDRTLRMELLDKNQVKKLIIKCLEKLN